MKKRILLCLFAIISCLSLAGCSLSYGRVDELLGGALSAPLLADVAAFEQFRDAMVFTNDYNTIDTASVMLKKRSETIKNLVMNDESDALVVTADLGNGVMTTIDWGAMLRIDVGMALGSITGEYYLATQSTYQGYKNYLSKFEYMYDYTDGWILYANSSNYAAALSAHDEIGLESDSKSELYNGGVRTLFDPEMDGGFQYKDGFGDGGRSLDVGGKETFMGVVRDGCYSSIDDVIGVPGDDNFYRAKIALALLVPSSVDYKVGVQKAGTSGYDWVSLSGIDVKSGLGDKAGAYCPGKDDSDDDGAKQSKWLEGADKGAVKEEGFFRVRKLGLLMAYDDTFGGIETAASYKPNVFTDECDDQTDWFYPTTEREEAVELQLIAIDLLKEHVNTYGYNFSETSSGYVLKTSTKVVNNFQDRTGLYARDNECFVQIEVKIESDTKYTVRIDLYRRNRSDDFFTSSYGLCEMEYSFNGTSYANGLARVNKDVVDDTGTFSLVSDYQDAVSRVVRKAANAEIWAIDFSRVSSLSSLRTTIGALKSRSGDTSLNAANAESLKSYYKQSGIYRRLIENSDDGTRISNEQLVTKDIPHDIVAGRVRLGTLTVKSYNMELLHSLIGINGGLAAGATFMPIDDGANYGLALMTYPITRVDNVELKSDNSFKFNVVNSGMYINLLQGGFHEDVGINASSIGLKRADDAANVYIYNDSSVMYIRDGISSVSKLGDAGKMTMADIRKAHEKDSDGIRVTNGGVNIKYVIQQGSTETLVDDTKVVSKSNFLLLDYLEGIYLPEMYYNESVLALGRKIHLNGSTFNGASIYKGMNIGNVIPTFGGGVGSSISVKIEDLLDASKGMRSITVNTGTIYKYQLSTPSLTANAMNGYTDTYQSVNGGNIIEPGYDRVSYTDILTGGVTYKVYLGITEDGKIDIWEQNDRIDVGSLSDAVYVEIVGGTETDNEVAYSIVSNGIIKKARIDMGTAKDMRDSLHGHEAKLKLTFRAIVIKSSISFLESAGTDTVTTYNPIKLAADNSQVGAEGGAMGVSGASKNVKYLLDRKIYVKELRTGSADTYMADTSSLLAGYETNTSADLPRMFVLGRATDSYSEEFINKWLKQGADEDEEHDGNLTIWAQWLQKQGYTKYPFDLENIDDAIAELFKELERMYDFSSLKQDDVIILDPNAVEIIQKELDTGSLETEARIIRAACLVAGILMALYALLLIVAWLIDAGTTGEGDGLLYKISFKKMKAATGMSRKDAIEMSTEGYKYTTLGMILPSTLLIASLGVIFIVVDPIDLVSNLISLVDGLYRSIRENIFNVK